MKNIKPYRRVDLASSLALLCALLILLFQGVFIFELYHVDYARIERFLPSISKPFVERWVGAIDQGTLVVAPRVIPDAVETCAVPSKDQKIVDDHVPAGSTSLAKEATVERKTESVEDKKIVAARVPVASNLLTKAVLVEPTAAPSNIVVKVEPVRVIPATPVKVTAPKSSVVIVDRSPATEAEMKALISQQEKVSGEVKKKMAPRGK